MLEQSELGGLGPQLLLVRAGAGDQEAHAIELVDHARHRLERDLEALLVDEPPDQQHQLLVRAREAGAELAHRRLVEGLQVGRVDAVRDHGDALFLDPVDVGDVVPHVRGARDHLVGAVRHPGLDVVDVALGMLVDPALVAAVLGRVDRHHQRRAQALGEVVARDRDEPVVPVYEIEVEAVAELDARREHVRVHVLDPGDELSELGRPERLAHAVEVDTLHDLLRGRLLAATGQNVHLDALGGKILRELSHVPRKAALDQRRVLPGQHQDLQVPHLPQGDAGARSGAMSSSGARPRSPGSIGSPPGISRKSFMAPPQRGHCVVERAPHGCGPGRRDSRPRARVWP